MKKPDPIVTCWLIPGVLSRPGASGIGIACSEPSSSSGAPNPNDRPGRDLRFAVTLAATPITAGTTLSARSAKLLGAPPAVPSATRYTHLETPLADEVMPGGCIIACACMLFAINMTAPAMTAIVGARPQPNGKRRSTMSTSVAVVVFTAVEHLGGGPSRSGLVRRARSESCESGPSAGANRLAAGPSIERAWRAGVPFGHTAVDRAAAAGEPTFQARRCYCAKKSKSLAPGRVTGSPDCPARACQ
jgi:hypothetical protein